MASHESKDESHKASWTKRLSQKLKRRSQGDSSDDGVRRSIDEEYAIRNDAALQSRLSTSTRDDLRARQSIDDAGNSGTSGRGQRIEQDWAVGSSTSSTSQTAIPRKPVHATDHTQTSTRTPIAEEFSRPQVSEKDAMKHANILLHGDSIKEGSNSKQTQGSRSFPLDGTRDSELAKDMQDLSLNRSTANSPTSFVSAEEGDHRRTEQSGTDLPTKEEIVERSKYSSTDTTVHERVAPAVVHETIERKVHEITEERITRDIHHYHHVHRILPVHDVEVLPAKHYRIVDGKQVEMRPEEVAQSRIDAWESSIVPKIEV